MTMDALQEYLLMQCPDCKLCICCDCECRKPLTNNLKAVTLKKGK